ncbi:MAG: phytanoyl-CoA dioxygenase [Deltaproteobacteria bacterium]|nr:MAG: phytanoyl-CoA dioxygenase [Deltaproteobacteria bacterium]
MKLPLTHPPAGASFELGEEITPEQRAFLDEHGFVRFRGFLSMDEVQMIRDELERIAEEWIAEDREFVNGIPIKYGEDENGKKFVNRYAFTSLFSEKLHALLSEPRFETVRRICGDDFRLGHEEKDGVVVNNYLNVPGSNYTKLGWHVDSLRDVFYGKLPQPMWNVGIYLDDSYRDKGALRLIPGTHKQSLMGVFFGKRHFMDHETDPREYIVEADAGDLTLHDGRMWHRVGQSPLTGEASRRRTMYMPFINGPVEKKDEAAKTPFYHRFSRKIR